MNAYFYNDAILMALSEAWSDLLLSFNALVFKMLLIPDSLKNLHQTKRKCGEVIHAS